MRKIRKKILLLCLTMFMMVGMATTAFAADGTTLYFKNKGYLNGGVSISNVIGWDKENMEYIEGKNIPTYYCNSPAEIDISIILSGVKVYKVTTDEQLEKIKKSEEVQLQEIPQHKESKPAGLQTIIWSVDETPEFVINEDLEFPPSHILTESGTYYVYIWDEQHVDHIKAIVIVDGGNIVPATVQATPTASNVLVNGKQTAFDAYTIEGNNYFKLRDLAYVLNGSDKQFEVAWDGVNNAILLTSGTPYNTAGGEMEGKGAGGKTTTTPTSSKISLDGKEIVLTAYTINGNNYFKLRDIGQTFNFGVTWDGTNNTIIIDTNIEYSE